MGAHRGLRLRVQAGEERVGRRHGGRGPGGRGPGGIGARSAGDGRAPGRRAERVGPEDAAGVPAERRDPLLHARLDGVDDGEHLGRAHGAVAAGVGVEVAPLEGEVREVEGEAVAREGEALVAAVAAALLAAVELAVVQGHLEAPAAVGRGQPGALGDEHGALAGLGGVEDGDALEEAGGVGGDGLGADGVAVEAGVEDAGLELEAGAGEADVAPEPGEPEVRLGQHDVVEVPHPEGEAEAEDERGPRQPVQAHARALDDEVGSALAQPPERRQEGEEPRHRHRQRHHVGEAVGDELHEHAGRQPPPHQLREVPDEELHEEQEHQRPERREERHRERAEDGEVEALEHRATGRSGKRAEEGPARTSRRGRNEGRAPPIATAPHLPIPR